MLPLIVINSVQNKCVLIWKPNRFYMTVIASSVRSGCKTSICIPWFDQCYTVRCWMHDCSKVSPVPPEPVMWLPTDLLWGRSRNVWMHHLNRPISLMCPIARVLILLHLTPLTNTFNDSPHTHNPNHPLSNTANPICIVKGDNSSLLWPQNVD